MSCCNNIMSIRFNYPKKGLLFAASVLLLTKALYAQPTLPNYVWLEGEAGVTVNFDEKKVNRAGWGHPEYLSDAKWLQVSVEAKDVDSALPPDGILLQYSLNAPKAGSYAVWNRVGFEYVR